jgi:nucleoside-diphosphate-sugar epimerase
MKVLVTGGAGFIGSHLVEALVGRGDQVVVLDDLSTGKPENLAPLRDRIRFVEGSVADWETAQQAVVGCDAVLHEGALPSVARSVQDPVTSNHANVTGTLTMLTAARDAGVKRFVFAASSSAYGSNPALPKREDMLSQPKSPYAVSKLAGELYCQVFAQLYPIETVCLRYFNVFGPRQDPHSPYSGVIAAFVARLMKGETIRLDGDGTQSRDFTYVENVVQANLKALEAEGVSGEVFNVGCGQRYDLRALIRELAEIIGVEPDVDQRPARAGDVPHSLADISKARRLLGYEPTVDFREGLRRLVQWHREKGD